MGGTLLNTRWYVARAFQVIAMVAFAVVALALVGATIGAAAGLLPWLQLDLRLSDGTAIPAGPAVQIGLAVIALLLCAYMPANFRVLALENSHRAFNMRMEDVANAYWAAHRADRTGIFKMKSEFDAVKERLLFLRNHPDLGGLEPDILEVAAQMSQTSAELARVYSDENVARARNFLDERQEEAETMQRRIEEAQAEAIELRRWIERIEIEEDTARAQLDRLTGYLDTLLPKLGMRLAPAEEPVDAGPEIIQLPPPRDRKTKRTPAAVAAE